MPRFNPDNLLSVKFPNIFKQIHPTLNPGVDIEKITYASRKNLLWRCNNPNIKCDHHVWPSTVANRTNGTRCPYCSISNGKACPCTSLSTLKPEIAKQFDYEHELNKNLDPTTLKVSSGKYVYWKCTNPAVNCDHHRWGAKVADRTHDNTGCPYCANKKICICNSLATLRPEIAKEFDFERNIGLSPDMLSVGSDKSVHWKCSKAECDHHVWTIEVYHRTGKDNTGCPYCSHNKVCPCGSFAALYPDLLKEFDYNKNKNVNPVELAPFSSKVVWWKCLKASCGKEWEICIGQRTYYETGCPRCRQSHLEKLCMYILRKHKIDFKDQKTFDDCKNINKLPFDFFLLDLNILAELDGEQHFTRPFHADADTDEEKLEKLEKTKKRDKIKTDYTRTNNIHFIRISYSEIKNLEKHLLEFIDLVQNSSQRVERFYGKEYLSLE